MTREILSSGDLIADRRADYARALAETGADAEAADLMRQALERAPAWAAGWFTLGGFLEKAGDAEAAGEAFRTVLRLTATDIFGAGLKLAALGQAGVPEAAPSAYVARLFDDYAGRFDRSLVEKLGYAVPERLLALIRGFRGSDARFAHAVDLGCGTGLMGQQLRSAVSYLEGYDLSAGMLARARAKRIYDHLGAIDLSLADSAPAGRPAGAPLADLVTAADVMIYLGTLDPIFRTAAALLAPGGLFGFSVEESEDGRDRHLRPSLRYAHGEAYVRACAETFGFSIARLERATLRRDGASDIAGLLVLAERRAGAARGAPVCDAAAEGAARPTAH